MDWILTLALVTFALVIVFLAWNWMSTKRRQETGGRTAGFGGPNDPLSGAAEGIRRPDVIRASLDEATQRERERAREEP
ncbi:MAG: hypothetical protein JSR21_13420 [Proteobacteria bacterium]|nr:hypothetical protein [Pseudomonadota bacterium]